MRGRMWELKLWISMLVWALILWKLEVTSAENTTVIENTAVIENITVIESTAVIENTTVVENTTVIENTTAIESITVIDGIEFGEMNVVVKTESLVFHIEVDINNPDQLVFADGSALKTLAGKKTKPIVGEAIHWGFKDGIGTEARFQYITGFAQLTTKTLLAVDYGNHCLRLVDRLILRTSHFAGDCLAIGWFRDGANARFDHPLSVVQDPSRPNMVLVTDQRNNAVRQIDFSDYPTTTKTLLFVSSGSKSPSSLAFDTEMNLIVSNQHFIRKDSANFYTMKVDFSEVVGSTTYGFRNGAFSIALFSSPQEVAALSPNIILVADEDNNNLRVLNESSRFVSSICYRSSTSSASGTAGICKLNKPHSVLVKKDDEHSGQIYVGEHSSIKAITYALPIPANNNKD